MQSSEEAPNWIPTSFSTTSETGEGDSVCSFPSLTTPGSNAVDLQSNDPSFDVSQHKSCVEENAEMNEENVEIATTESTSAINVFEEDARSSWSEEPKQTEFKETAIDDISQNSVSSQKSSSKKPCSETEFKETVIDDNSQDSVNSQKSSSEKPSFETEFKETVLDDSSQNSVSNHKSSTKRPCYETEFKETAIDDSSQNSGISEKSSKKPRFETEFKETAIDESSQNSVSSQKSSTKKTNDETEYKETAIDDSSQHSISSQKSSTKKQCFDTEFKETAIDDSSQISVSSQKSSSKKPCSDDEGKKRDFPPENLFEYMWPQGSGEFFILQEQICDYLNVKSFKRKYPDLVRRSVDIGEKQFLREKGVVTEMQCDLGLTALRSEEVLELLSKDYPDHYKEYIKVLREKEQQSISEKHKEYVATNSDKNKMMDLVKKAVHSAAEYNAHLNQERRDERRSCMDLQTFTIHYPVKSNKPKNNNTKPGKYPVALLPGQFQDYYKEYTPEELKYLPVNTVLYGPLKELNSIKALSDGSQSDSDDSTASDGSCSSSQGTHDDSSSSSEKPDVKTETPDVKPEKSDAKPETPDVKSEKSDVKPEKSNAKPEKSNVKPEKSNVKPEKSNAKPEKSYVKTKKSDVKPEMKKPAVPGSPYQSKIKPNAVCKVCKVGTEGRMRDGKREELVHCSDCENSAHPSCIELTADVVTVLKTYPWQCMDCKVCSNCRDPNEEDKMLFCDTCDRGYHTFCVGLKNLPQGKWICRQCGTCSICGVKQPGPESSKAQWQYDLSKGNEEGKKHQPKLICVTCFKKKR